MQYLVLLYGDETNGAEPGTPEFEAELGAYAAFDELAADAVRGGAALQLSTTSVTIRRVGGDVTVTDGPFAETVEVLGGYYVLEARDLDQVVDLVRHLPATSDPSGGSEVRPMAGGNLFREEGEALPDLWLATIHRPGGVEGTDEHGDAAAHERFVATHADRLVRGVAVHPSTSATTVRVRDGELELADGPFSDVTTVVGGIYVIQGSAEQAREVAADIPVAEGDVVELRPTLDLSTFFDEEAG